MFPLFYLEKCSSTNDEILYFVKENRLPAAVYTFNQINGRGQYGNTWKTNKDRNLAYSIALKVRDFQISGSLFNFRTASILRDFIAKLTKNSVETKWPNDIIINGKKVSGMLIEKQKIEGEDYYIAGIGINVLQTDFSGLPKAGSILTQTQQRFDLEDFTAKLHTHFCASFQNELSAEDILEDFNENLFRKNKISVFELNGVRQNGIIKYADENGFLWIDMEKDGLQKFNNKEIELLY